MSRVVNVAVVGAGEAAMVIHLPTLALCSHMYKCTALVDISKQTLDHCAAKFHVPATYTSVEEMLEKSPEVEVVFIMNANEYHVEHAIQCLRGGKHVFLEKPVALSLQGAREVAKAQKESGRLVFVGYMRRYSTAFLRVKEIVSKLPPGSIHYVKVRGIIGRNVHLVPQSGAFPVKFTDFPPNSGAERQARADAVHQEALGEHTPKDRATWFLLNSLGAHDTSAMRELFGMPKKVAAASRSEAGDFAALTFQYDDFIASFEVGRFEVKVFDAHIEVFAGPTYIKLQFDTPYIKGLPITATIMTSAPNGDHVTETIRPTYEDAYTQEFQALYDCIVNGAPVKTTVEDAIQDLTLFDEAMALIRA